MKDDFNLQRFAKAQDPEYQGVLKELRAGQKRGHWMWYIFPQIEGLGYSFMSQKFAIGSREEACAYLEHPVLGQRLRECTQLALAVTGRTAEQIFGDPDVLKFRSSMTLFMASHPENQIFKEALDKYFQGIPDEQTLDILKALEEAAD